MATFRFRPGSPDLDIITPPPAEGNESATRKLSAPVPSSFDPDTGTDLAHVGVIRSSADDCVRGGACECRQAPRAMPSTL